MYIVSPRILLSSFMLTKKDNPLSHEGVMAKPLEVLSLGNFEKKRFAQSVHTDNKFCLC